MKSKLLFPVFFIVWVTVLISVFFIIQKPAVITIGNGFGHLVSSVLLGCLFVCTSAGLGYLFLYRLYNDSVFFERLVLSAGIGMGIFGISGFLIAAMGLANGWLMLFVLACIFLWLVWKGYMALVWQDMQNLWRVITETSKTAPRWISIFALLFLFLDFLLSLAPPADAFDGLFYHLTVPFLWMRDGGVRPINMPHYWFPSLLEGMFVWPMSLGFDSIPQLFHLVFGLLSCLLVWDLTCQLFGARAAWWSIAIFLSMTSLPWLASWAYTDFGLIFYSLGALVSLFKWKESGRDSCIWVCGAMTGFAMGIKYTSFILPLVILFYLLWQALQDKRRLVLVIARFAGMAVLTSVVWYLRNWIWTGNPVYPFVFGGSYWDAFRAAWYSGAGSGIGWSVPAIASLPFVVTFGYRDQNYFDGRFGPLFLILFPLTLTVIWKAWKNNNKNWNTIFLLTAFGFLFLVFWTLGVIKTENLLQSRLLWPGLIPLIPLMAAGVLELDFFDIPKFRLSFVFSTLVGIIVFVFLLDFCLYVIVRNPLSVALGMEPRDSYMARIQPGYAQALSLADQTPLTAHIYLLNEPRSYWMNRLVQPDPIMDNLPHDLYIYPTNEMIFDAWTKLGYTHILARKDIFSGKIPRDFAVDNYDQRLSELKESLFILEESTDYILFSIPTR